MKLAKLERGIITQAFNIHHHEKRTPPYWRVAVKAPLPRPPHEVGSEPVSPWMFVKSETDRYNQLSPDHGRFIQLVHKILGQELEPSAADRIGMPVFARLGYFYALSRKKWERPEAEELMGSWIERSLDCSIVPFFEPGADLFSGQILPDSASVDTIPEYRGRSMESITSAGDERVIKQYQKAVATLEKGGLIVAVSGCEIGYTWDGLNLTRKGIEEAKRLLTPAAKAEPQARPIKCINCGGVYLETTETFPESAPPIGNMFRLLPEYKDAGWNHFAPDAIQRDLICPDCGHGYVSEETGRLVEGALLPEEASA